MNRETTLALRRRRNEFAFYSSITFLLVALCAAQAARADEKQSWRDRFELYGHVTLAYAESELDNPRPLFAEEAILGVPEDGTFDYRMAALQARFKAHEQHTLILQLSHRSFGDSPLDPLTDDIELDWLYWEWRWHDEGRLRLGRFPTPAGIFNELRDVGTVLPFFRPAFDFYREGSITSETVDGVGISHRFFADSAWNVDADLYYGRFEVLEQTTDNGLNEVDARDAIGGQLWLNTPIDGLRFGLGGIDWEVEQESLLHLGAERWRSYYFSAEGNFERFVARAEYRHVDVPIEVPPVFIGGETDVDAFYWQLGWRITDKLSLWVQSEVADIEQRYPSIVGGSFDYTNREDDGVAINYALRPSLVLKAEYHEQSFEAPIPMPVFGPGGLQFDFTAAPAESEYFIISTSFSF